MFSLQCLKSNGFNLLMLFSFCAITEAIKTCLYILHVCSKCSEFMALHINVCSNSINQFLCCLKLILLRKNKEKSFWSLLLSSSQMIYLAKLCGLAILCIIWLHFFICCHLFVKSSIVLASKKASLHCSDLSFGSFSETANL